MKKILFILLCSFTVIACKNSDTASEVEQIKEELKDETKKEAVEAEDLLGKIKIEDLEQPAFQDWYQSSYKSLTAEKATLNEIEKHIHDYDIKLFMGTWCSDSQRVVPQFIRLLEKVNYNENNLEMYALDENKQSPLKIEEEYDIQYVPTIIFMKNGEEVNRFVEFAQESIAQDVAKIVNPDREYQNPYAE